MMRYKSPETNNVSNGNDPFIVVKIKGHFQPIYGHCYVKITLGTPHK